MNASRRKSLKTFYIFPKLIIIIDIMFKYFESKKLLITNSKQSNNNKKKKITIYINKCFFFYRVLKLLKEVDPFDKFSFSKKLKIILERIFQEDPDKRIGSQELKSMIIF